MPDLNTLPNSPPPSAAAPAVVRPRRISITSNIEGPPSPRSPSLSSLQAAAAMNASRHSPHRHPQGLERRRSSLMNNLSINDPTTPAPGEMQHSNGGPSAGSPRVGRRSIALATADPHHQRTSSLGEIHQELENEQEAQVNRLLYMIRLQQDQLAAMQRQQQQQAVVDPSSPTSTELSHPSFALYTPTSSAATEHPSSPRSTLPPHLPQGHFTRPASLSRQSSARFSTAGTSSANGSPSVRPVSSIGPLTEDFLLGGSRDECAFYQAETHALTRENQMLKLRIRELERQVSDLSSPSAMSSTAANLTHAPSHHSPLLTPPANLTGDQAPAMAAAMKAD
ncbi:hypothetical protein BAUCODRAFT_34167 [Baudoinia panamericana UAMH 10762]|uniref:Uncharacterized protein n=1 Tax=Baudoinia panamericana (strain UAMH 10762) TaxID=717646 RepID=M2LQR3_BAUPA|nr:uncharacterized protein BAUCODRAFT_34167 [Baudoinia panamericana UAMH 10762]EMC96772.1 hypothetical protein BAUCODRAFT_34167 [Baudoinia panamericana UAMH 10762]